MKTKWTSIGALLLGAVLLASSGARADAVTDWNDIVERTIAPADPYTQIRSATIAQLAVFEAVNAIAGEYEPYLGTIAAPGGASPEAAAISAAHRVLTTLHSESASMLDTERERSLAQVLDGQAKADGIAVGQAAADAIIALRVNDGSPDVPYTPSTLPGRWRPTPPDLTPAFGSGLGGIQPFAIRSGTQFRLRAPPSLRSTRYARDYNEVRRVGEVNSSSRPQDRTDVARYYGVTDVLQVWYPVARQVSVAQGKSLSENARIFALMSIAVFDAAVAVFDSKFFHDLWRPVTAIRAGDTDGNRRTEGDPEWLPLIQTPPFPSYPSGHGGLGNAARRIAEDAYGPRGHAIVLGNPAIPEVVLHYTNFRDIMTDIDDARVYGGVHYRFDQESAARQGRRIGSHILRHHLCPRRERQVAPDASGGQAQLTPERTPGAGGTRDAAASR